MAAPRRATVSLGMIVRNEGHQLNECLAPVAQLFDDIVIVDTGSHDNTREVAGRYTSHVVDFPWCDDFAAARNETLKHARGEWFFWLDADDRVSPANVEKLRALLAGLAEAPKAFVMETALHQDDQSRDRQRLTSHLRLFRRHPALHWERRVHEAITPWPTALGYEFIYCDVRIEHLGYRDVQLVQRKLRRNVRLLRMDFAVAPDDPCVLMDLGSAYAQLGNAAEARRYLHAVLVQDRRYSLLRRRACTTLGELETIEGNFAAAAELLERALEDYSSDQYLLYMYSEALFNLGLHGQAKAALMKILQQPADAVCFQIGVPHDLRQRLVPLALGEVLRAGLALHEAEEVLRGVTGRFPADPSAWFFLGRGYVYQRNWAKLDEITARLTQCANGRFFAGLLLAWGQLARGEWLAAEATLDRLIPPAPCMTLLRTMRAECLHRRSAAQAAQIQACRDVLRLQPHNARAREILSRLEGPGVTSYWPNAERFGSSVELVMGVAGASPA